MGAPFTLLTDNSALRYIYDMAQPPPLFARWKMTLAIYDIDIVTKPGRKHSNADALSRIPHRKPHFLVRIPKEGPFPKDI